MNERMISRLLSEAVQFHNRWKNTWEPLVPDPSYQVPNKRIESAFRRLFERLQENYPFFHPRYAGQMIKPPHPIAVASYLAAMQINPNNHARDGGPATAKMEFDVVADIARMFGYKEHLGHLTSSGTIANLEALWVARSLHPNKSIAFSDAAHYTHKRMCQVIGAAFNEIPSVDDGTMNLNALEEQLKSGSIGTVVATIGSTSLGALDPLESIIPLCKKYGVRVHADAAYGGFFILLAHQKKPIVRAETFHHLKECDSIVVDPHKHGLQPYGCGCIVFRDPSVGTFYHHDSPYTYFTSKALHLGEIALECSRAGASAAALWCTLQCIPLKPNTGLGAILVKTRKAALDWSMRMKNSEYFVEYTPPMLDIVTYIPNVEPFSASRVTGNTDKIFTSGMKRRKNPLYLATLVVDSVTLKHRHPTFIADRSTVKIFRSVLMKPEHRSFVPTLLHDLEEIGAGV